MDLIHYTFFDQAECTLRVHGANFPSRPLSDRTSSFHATSGLRFGKWREKGRKGRLLSLCIWFWTSRGLAVLSLFLAAPGGWLGPRPGKKMAPYCSGDLGSACALRSLRCNWEDSLHTIRDSHQGRVWSP